MPKQKSDDPEGRGAASSRPEAAPEAPPPDAPRTAAEATPPADPDAALAPHGEAAEPPAAEEASPVGAEALAPRGEPAEAPAAEAALAAEEAPPADADAALAPQGEAAGAEAVGAEATPVAGAAAAQDARPEAVADLPPAGPAPVAEAHHDAAEDEAHEEERGWSFAARALVVLFLLIAGGALAIWAAPRVAPHLPAGMAPVAAWLTPGRAEAEAEAAARTAELRAELEQAVAALEARIAALPDEDALEARAGAVVSEAESRLGGRIDALEQSISEADPQAIGDRVGRLETAVDGAAAELASLRQQIEAGVAATDADTVARIDTYRAELDGVKAEVGRLAGAVSGLGARLDEAEARAAARVQEVEAEAEEAQEQAAAARSAAAAGAEVERIRTALASGEPYDEALAGLGHATGAQPPLGLAAAASTGAPTLAALRAGFGDAAHQAIRASIVASAGEGVFARSRAFLEAQVASRSLEPRAGLDPDAVLSRMEDALRRDDLEAALAEAENLPSEARAAMQDWLEAARRRADAEAGLAELDASVAAMN